MRRCAHIEVDVLRYFVVGRLVAGSAGSRPEDDPDGYREQCRLGDDNTVRLAYGYAERGFSSVIEGFDDDRILDQPGLTRTFAGLAVTTVLLTCRPDVLALRRAARGWGTDLPAVAERQRAFSAACTRIVDTTDASAQEHADQVYRLVRDPSGSRT
jgi:hypothetical protein